MRTIAVINQKGGVGKTTTAVNFAAALARDGYRVLLADLDPQAHATLHVGVETADSDLTSYDVLTRGASVFEAARTVQPADPRQAAGEPLTLVPAHIDLVAAEHELAERDDRNAILAAALQRAAAPFDACVLDCPPSLGLITVNALASADDVLIPLQPHFLALQGLSQLLKTVTLVQGALRPQLRVAGVVLCMYESATRLAQEVTQDVTAFFQSAAEGDAWFGGRVFETRIRRNIKLAECPSFGQTIFDYAPDSHGAADYRALAREIAAVALPKPRAVKEDVAAAWIAESDPLAAVGDAPGPAANETSSKVASA